MSVELLMDIPYVIGGITHVLSGMHPQDITYVWANIT
jgi:hypothetical protein